MNRFSRLALPALLFLTSAVSAQQTADQSARNQALRTRLESLQAGIAALDDAVRPRDVYDVSICSKAVEWILRHDEFYKPAYFEQAARVLLTGETRLQQLASGRPVQPPAGSTIVLGYRSRIDGSVQPYALTLPLDFDPDSATRLPLYLKLHGRANQMNEVNFFQRYQGRAAAADQRWIQLDVYGRGSNAYRWAGETDVFEALADVRRRFRIDDDRITLHGFSMGGAGAWHLGLHHPHLWSSVGAGAGFVDFYRYQAQPHPRPPHQHATLGIYDSIDYALNAFNVPVVGYGGELDKQLLAAKSIHKAAAEQGVSIRLLIGPETGHKFHPRSLREFMAFHAEHSAAGRKSYTDRKHVRFVTRSLKYHQCDWLAIEEVERVYEPATVDARVDDSGNLLVTTGNIRVLRLARGLAVNAIIDGARLPLDAAADGLLPDVYYQRRDGRWTALDYQASKAFPDNPDRHKRHGLQGPIDDAFTGPFLCVRGTGRPWSEATVAWSDWTRRRFQAEFDKWLRGEVPLREDSAVTDEDIANHNLVLFGDPGSNAILRRIVGQLPVKWTPDGLEVDGEAYDPATHAFVMIHPNPLNARRYVVINSGHTFHEKDFQASNAWLFPRLGDAAVLKFRAQGDGYVEETVKAWNFDSDWQFPSAR